MNSSSSTGKTHSPNLWRRVGFSLFIILLTLTLVEVGLWLSGVTPLRLDLGLKKFGEVPPLDQPALGFLQQDGDYLRTSDETLKGPGYNSAPGVGPGPQRFAKKKDPRTLRIAFFGGSNTYGFLSQKNWPELLAKNLRHHLGRRPLEILNVAQIGTPSSIIVIQMPEILHHFKPDIVVVQSAHNELLDIPQFYLIEKPHTRLGHLFLDLADQTYIYSMLRRLYIEKLASYQPVHRTDGKQAFTFSRWNSEMIRLAKERLRRNYVEMKRICDHYKARLVVATAPYAPGKVEDLRVFSMFAYSRDTTASHIKKTEFLFGKVDTTLKQKDADMAERVLRTFEEKEHGMYWAFWGRVHELNGHYQKAASHYQRAMALSWRPIGNVMNQVVREFSAKHHLPLLDVQRMLLEKSGGQVMDLDLFADFFHPNEQGHTVIAQEAGQAFTRAGLMPR